MVEMGEIRFMAPTITDRIHYFVMSDPEDFWKLPDTKKIGKMVHGYKTKVNNAIIGLYHVTSPKGDSAVGLIVPDKKTRDMYFRIGLVTFFVCFLWIMLNLALIAVAFTLLLAVLGFSMLLIIMRPIGSYILLIFGPTTIIALILITVLLAYYPRYNRRLVRSAIPTLREIITLDIPALDFTEIPVHLRFLSLSIRDRLPKGFQKEVEAASKVLRFIPNLDIESYALREEPW